MAGRCRADSSHSVLTGISIMDTCEIFLCVICRACIITSNRESGYGRYDVMMEPKNEMANAVIMEFKVRDSGEEKSLEDTADAALRQIEQQRYEEALENRGISGSRIRKYAFAFEGKEVLIKS